ncbi:MAG: permease of an ABC transporter, partial [Synergistales bacterium]|nr:permease of an ABC transporter [Synergistales bacterium]
MSGVIPISNWQLALSTILLVLAGVLAASLRLGIVKSLAVSAVR